MDLEADQLGRQAGEALEASGPEFDLNVSPSR